MNVFEIFGVIGIGILVILFLDFFIREYLAERKKNGRNGRDDEDSPE